MLRSAFLRSMSRFETSELSNRHPPSPFHLLSLSDCLPATALHYTPLLPSHRLGSNRTRRIVAGNSRCGPGCANALGSLVTLWLLTPSRIWVSGTITTTLVPPRPLQPHRLHRNLKDKTNPVDPSPGNIHYWNEEVAVSWSVVRQHPSNRAHWLLPNILRLSEHAPQIS